LRLQAFRVCRERIQKQEPGFGSAGFSQLDVLVIIPGIKIITYALQIPLAARFLQECQRSRQQTRVRQKLFTVDIAKSGGKIAPIRIPLQQVWLHLPRIRAGADWNSV
jgi:hypothetical protein